MKEKILIIEDDPLIRNELKTLLQSNGYKTVAPEDFSDVIDQIKAEQPHLIILDIKLPGTSGDTRRFLGKLCQSYSLFEGWGNLYRNFQRQRFTQNFL